MSTQWTALQSAPGGGKIELRSSGGQTLDQHLAAGEGGRYDFAFIDADKSSYDAYYERCLVLLRPGGLIAIDNVLWSGRVAEPADAADADTAALQALNAKLLRDDRVDLALLPISDGLTLARKR
jgi:caffeoyl-CoA O-methyltransferase